MAMRDYICCSECDDKLIYDGSDNIRESLESKFGDEKAKYWTVKLVCPACLAQLSAIITEQAATIDALNATVRTCDELSRLARIKRDEQAALIKALEDALLEVRHKLDSQAQAVAFYGEQPEFELDAIAAINELIGE